MLEAALAAGVAAAGGDVLLGGVLPTPGRAAAARAATASTSPPSSRASHNPYRDNGIKFFGADGFKLVRRDRGGDRGAPRGEPPPAPTRDRPRRARCTARDEDYLRELHDALRGRSTSPASNVAARLRQRRDVPRRARDLPPPAAPTVTVHRRRARRAQHQRRLRLDPRRRARRARSRRAATTSASPSTATATACSPSTATGAVVDGDELHRPRRAAPARPGRLPGDGVAVTVMTNYGFHAAMRERGHRGRDDRGRRPLRARGAARARLGARRRAVRPHHRHGLRAAPATASPPRC